MEDLRPATADDLPRVRALVDAAYRPYVARMGRPPQPMLDDYAARLAAGELSVLERDGALVGLLVLVERPDGMLLHNVAVDPAVRGQGFGRRLLIAAEAAARARGYARMTLYTHATMTENRALYRRAGWREIGRFTEDGFDRVFFEKHLETQTMTDTANRPQAEGIVKLETERVRVMEWRFAPGAATGWHRHEYDYVIVPLATGRLKIVGPDGAETVAELTHGEPYARSAGTEHDVINASDGPFAFMEVEIK
jgi:ribosomal protein S18 acetylase RimI-like enzyme/quercetin dioxygenase-like cupin family protein